MLAGPSSDHPAEEVLAPAVLDEGVALEVEEDVAGRGLGQAREAAAGLGRRQQLVDGRAAARDASWMRAWSWTRS